MDENTRDEATNALAAAMDSRSDIDTGIAEYADAVVAALLAGKIPGFLASGPVVAVCDELDAHGRMVADDDDMWTKGYNAAAWSWGKRLRAAIETAA